MINNSENRLVKNNDEVKINIEPLVQKGKQILNENTFFNDLDYIMSNNDFRCFYENYFKDFSDIKIVMLYMKLYETIQKEYKELHNTDIDKELLAYMMRELMMDNTSRKNIMLSFNDFTENKYKDHKKRFILDIFNNKEKLKEIKN